MVVGYEYVICCEDTDKSWNVKIDIEYCRISTTTPLSTTTRQYVYSK